MKKVLKVVGISILVVLVLFMIHAIRNYIILSKINENVAKYVESNNMYMKTESDQVNVNYYRKDDKEVAIMNKDNIKMSNYKIGEKNDQFVETGESKTAKLNLGSMTVQVANIAKFDTKWQRFMLGSVAFIRSKNYKDKACYVIDNLISPYFLVGDKCQYTVEKDTGLLLKETTDGIVYEREYEFNKVEDSVFIEPDINEYIIQEN
ncbi:MAG: hypothetical protein IKG56_02460 [Clostridia bacterium]|nr:hypothetical protein [Clostridia bacterium]